MSGLAERARTRFVPALLTALGVTLLAAGLLSYTMPVTAEPLPTASPAASASIATPAPRITLPPLASVGPSASPSAPADRVATRVRVAALKIDLPVVKPGTSTDYPLCDVAQWIGALGQPGQGRATYLYAHARKGMFLPMLDASLTKKGAKMLGMVVEVWTSDDQRFLYEIVEVRPHQLDARRRGRGDRGAALAPDLRGAEGHARQAPGHRQADLAGGLGPRLRSSQGEAGGLRLVDRPPRSSRSCAGRLPQRRQWRWSGR